MAEEVAGIATKAREDGAGEKCTTKGILGSGLKETIRVVISNRGEVLVVEDEPKDMMEILPLIVLIPVGEEREREGALGSRRG